jgi:hypothetical protein
MPRQRKSIMLITICPALGSAQNASAFLTSKAMAAYSAIIAQPMLAVTTATIKTTKTKTV